MLEKLFWAAIQISVSILSVIGSITAVCKIKKVPYANIIESHVWGILIVSLVLWIMARSGLVSSFLKYCVKIIAIMTVLSIIEATLMAVKGVGHRFIPYCNWIQPINLVVSIVLCHLLHRFLCSLGAAKHYRNKVKDTWQYDHYSDTKKAALFFLGRILLLTIVVGIIFLIYIIS